MISAAVKEEKICENVTNALARRAARLAKEAASAEAKRQREEELARMDADKKKRNEFWNSYHSYYKPTLDELNKQCKATFSLYKDFKNHGIDVQADIDEQYRQLKLINGIIHQKYQEMYDARTHKDLVKAFTFMVASANPVAALLIGLVLMIVIDAKSIENKDDIRALRQRADDIRNGIEALKEEQGKLRFAQQDTLSQYTRVKDEKKALTDKLQALRKELEPQKEVLNAFGIYGCMMSAETKLDLELDLLTSGTVIEPVYHPNGGVADLSIITNNEKTLASSSYSDEKLTAMLEKWCELTEQTPAFRIAKTPESDYNLSTKPNSEQKPKQIKSSKNHQFKIS